MDVYIPMADNKVFYAQVLFSFIGIAFCCTMLFMDKDVQVYSPILFSLIATWYPAPRANALPHPDEQLQQQRDNNSPRSELRQALVA